MNFNTIIPSFEHFGFWEYLFIFLISFGESLAFIGLLIPGSFLVILFGFFAAQGGFSIFNLIWVIALGGILGDIFSYYLGKKGSKIFRFIKKQHLEKAENFIKRHGDKSIFLGRFIGPLRPIIPFTCGVLKMEIKKFIYWSIFSTLSWTISHVLFGYLIGKTLGEVEIWSTKLAALFLYFGLFFVLVSLLKWLLINKGKQFFAFVKSIFISLIQALATNPEIKKLVAKYPRFFHFLKKRLTRKNFYGLLLTILIFVFLYFLLNFLGIIKDILTTNALAQADIRLENLLYAYRHPLIAKFFLWVSLFGKWQIVASIAVIFLVILWLRKKWLYILPFLLTLAGSTLSDFLGKIILHRPRPLEVAFYHEGSYSFPSGHATIAVAIYGFIAYYLLKNVKKWRHRINILFTTIILILAIGFSRLYLGVHYLSDVIGGYLLGGLWLIIGLGLTEWLIEKKPIETIITLKSPKKIKIISAGLIIAEIIFFFFLAFNYHPPLVSEENEITIKLANNNILELFSGNSALPKYSEDLTGKKDEPISFIIIAKNDKQLIDDLKQAGWNLAERQNLKSILKLIEAYIFNQNYSTAPMTPSFWNTQVHNFGFEKPTATENIKERHHARFWKTNFVNPGGKQIYLGTASLDEGLKKSIIIHKINPNIDTEREQLFNDLKNARVIDNFTKQQFVEPLLGTNFAGDLFFTDGEIYILYLLN